VSSLSAQGELKLGPFLWVGKGGGRGCWFSGSPATISMLHTTEEGKKKEGGEWRSVLDDEVTFAVEGRAHLTVHSG